MAYQALYRKYRPVTFSDLIGQEHIVKTLKNQMHSGRISHAYLFCGTRGTGKTSTAKIFARAVNCSNPIEGEPCNQCSMCRNALSGRSMNIIEIDAASNNGVDHIREIREEVKYPPAEGKYKVYIIDEVHMLSQGAFNALLKTLEEPPAHVVFILATTDPQKVPITIHSRCQRFDFRRIPAQKIADALRRDLEKENSILEEQALHYIARQADGSMRDALSILDQCLAFYYGEEITLEKVLELLGAVDQSIFFEITKMIWNRDAAKSMELVEEMMEQGRDVGQFVLEWGVHLRNLLISISLPKPENILDVSSETIEQLKEQAQTVTKEWILFLIQEISRLSSELKYASNERILLEVQLMKLCSDFQEESYGALAARVSELEQKIKKGILSVPVLDSPPIKTESFVPEKVSKPKALPEELKKAFSIWGEVRNSFEISMKSILKEADLGYMENNCLTLICDNAGVEGVIKNKLDQIQAKLEEKLGRELTLQTTTKKDYEQWVRDTYGTTAESKEESEFDHTLKECFPEAEMV